MSVITDVPVHYRWWDGYQEPQFPAGLWMARALVVGDLSGGQRIARVQFRTTGSRRSTLYYNLEQVMVSDTEGTAKKMDLSTFNMDPLPAGTLSLPINLTIQLQQATILSNIDTKDYPPLPIFLGSPAGSIADSQLVLEVANVNAQFFQIGVQGYWWDQRAVGAQGGPQRPLTRLYG